MFKTLLIVSLLATTATSAFAQSPQRAGTPDQQKACSPDVSRYCRAVMKRKRLCRFGMFEGKSPQAEQGLPQSID